jgi:hypothetical protein
VVFLNNGEIKIIDFDDDIREGKFKVLEKTEKSEGEMLKIVSDSRDVTSHYLMTKKNG